jgi:hypothetical protein
MMIFHSYVSLPEGTTQPWELPMGQWVNQSDQRRAGSDICLRLGGHVSMSHLPKMGQGISKPRTSHENLRFDLPPGCRMQMLSSIIHPSAFNASQCHSVDSGPARHLEKGVLDHHSSLVVCLKQSPAPWSSIVFPIAWSQTIGRSGRQTAEGLVPPASRLERAFPVNFNSSNPTVSTHPWILVSKAHWNYLPLDMQ